ncbi:MAG: amino acid ABC transporter ATP-binding protein [Lachnospiraceae bacterium]|nr:amino acid ABC transporter ATP-binding protein [Lachnospiraceae bacterium]
MKPLIEVKGLSKSFGDLKVLENVNLTVNEGDRIAIIGGSGCGKSVFLRSLELLEKPDSGKIFIDGDEITARGANVPDIRKKLGMVYQQFYLFSHMDVMDNLCLAPMKIKKMSRKEAEEKADYWLSQVGLTSKAHAMPDTLSGGQKQRIAICRSLMMEPKVILFDEPTSALDPTMVGEVLAMIRVLSKRDLTMLIVTHEMNFAREVANRVLFFADKGIYEEGTPAEIFDAPQKPKTKAFIHRIKFFHFDITERTFDLMGFQGGIALFGEKYNMSQSLIWRLQLCSEEIVYEMMDGSYPGKDKVDIEVDISYSDDGSLVLLLKCGGNKYNVLDIDETVDDDKDHLGITIIKNVSKSNKYEYKDNMNVLEIII